MKPGVAGLKQFLMNKPQKPINVRVSELEVLVMANSPAIIAPEGIRTETETETVVTQTTIISQEEIHPETVTQTIPEDTIATAITDNTTHLDLLHLEPTTPQPILTPLPKLSIPSFVPELSTQQIIQPPSKPPQKRKVVKLPEQEDKENVLNNAGFSATVKSLPKDMISADTTDANKKKKYAHLLDFKPGNTPIALRVKNSKRSLKPISKLAF
jgi:hypothetical protein